MYGFGFWSLKGPLPPPPGRLLPPRLLPPLLKGPPPPLLIGIVHPPVNDLPTFPIKDGLPLHLWYGFLVSMIHGILKLCFLLEKSLSSFKSFSQFVIIPICAIPKIGFGDVVGLAKGSDM